MRWGWLLAAWACAGQVLAQPKDIKVSAATRLDWAFAAQGFGKEAAKLPAGHDSTRQRYQLFVPKSYDKSRAWPLVAFISPGDQPSGWNAWKAVCEKEGVFFCSPYAAGNPVAAGLRTRIVLDMLDDVRRNYRIDPDQTYLSGFSGGGRMACAIGFALPEVFGGVVPICGTNPVSGPAYLRHRLEERLSVAFVTGESDFNRKENEEYMGPWFQELGVRSKVWIVPKLGHAVPTGPTLAEVYAWLKEDMPRRLEDRKNRPGVNMASDEAPAAGEQARRMVESAQMDLKNPNRVWRGVSLLQGATARWPKSEAGAQARQILKQIGGDDKLLNLIGEQGAKDEVLALSSQAKALERFGQVQKAIEAWTVLATNYADGAVGRMARERIEALKRKN